MNTRETSQIPFDLSHQVSLRREDLIETGANSMAISLIDAWPNWPGQTTILAGPIGSGKSHIGAVWAGNSDAKIISAEEFQAGDLAATTAAAAGCNILMEDIDLDFAAEKALFHLLNTVRETGAYCLITSRYWPKEWDIGLPDLRSRLLAAQLVELSEPDDLLLKQVMVKLFSDRQLQVDAAIVDYCTVRMERSLESAARLVAEIDRTALSTRRMISRKTAAQALQSLGMI